MHVLFEAVAANMVWSIVGVVVLAGMITRALTTIVTSHARERSRREIAAYVAEGSITPEHAERLLRADVSDKGERCG